LRIEDDGSRPGQAARQFGELLASGCRFGLGPYGSDSTRAVAQANPDAVVWNHGGAADDVQRLPNVVSVPAPSSRYLVALGGAVAALRPGAAVALVSAEGGFARFAREALERDAGKLGLEVIATFGFRDPPAGVAEARPEAVLACGPVEREAELFRGLAPRLRETILAGISPGLAVFPDVLGGDPEGFLAPVQWHPELALSPVLGPASAQVLADAEELGYCKLDYVAAQAYAAALVADHCLELAPDDPLAAARRLRTTTFFGAFELDPDGLQVGHRLSVIRWRRGVQELVA
jgi:ABC-type branched-subunit amino acid transport system substrate-binding protein